MLWKNAADYAIRHRLAIRGTPARGIGILPMRTGGTPVPRRVTISRMGSRAENLARLIVERLQGAGHVAYFAGGCVRDRVMGREPKDFDVATSALPEQVLALFPSSRHVGAAFGVVLVRERLRKADRPAGGEIAPEQVEVATFRAEGAYSDGRHPDSVRFTDAREDAARRDFTCNGLFFDPVKMELHDFVGGQADIEKRILRAIGDPRHRFGEDHLRMLRAIRFAAKLDFQIDADTWRAMGDLAANISAISRERIGGELRLMLEHPSRASACALLHTSGLLLHNWPPALWPAPSPDGDCFVAFDFSPLAELPAQTAFVPALVRLHEIVSAAPPDPAIAAEKLRERFALSNQETAEIQWLLAHLGHTLPAAKNRLDHLRVSVLKRLMADPRWPQLLLLHRARPLEPEQVAAEDAVMAKAVAEGVAPEPFITGDVLISLGAAPGPAFKKWLEELYDRQLEKGFPDREAALAAAKRLVERRPERS